MKIILMTIGYLRLKITFDDDIYETIYTNKYYAFDEIRIMIKKCHENNINKYSI